MESDRDNFSDDLGHDAMEQQAANWLVLRDRGFTPAERREFDTWIGADTRHRELLAELEETWGLLGRAREEAPAPSAAPVEEARPRKGKIVWLASLLATAAVVVLAFTLWRRVGEQGTAFTQVASTAVGELRTIALPDGSLVRLNTDTSVEVKLTRGERQLRLARGEAHFKVASDPARPFVVTAGPVAVRAVGTRFNVRLRTEAVEVLVTEGKVRVDNAGRDGLATKTSSPPERPLLTANQRLVIPIAGSLDLKEAPPAAAAVMAPAEVEQALAWQSRRLEFVATPLGEIVAEFNRYNLHKLVIVDPRLESMRFGGTFPTDDYATLIRLLEKQFDVIADHGPNETRLRLAR